MEVFACKLQMQTEIEIVNDISLILAQLNWKISFDC